MPVLAWLLLQMAALAVPVHSSASAEARDLFAALDVDRIVICTPDGRKVLTRDGETGDEAVCLPCKAASLSVSVPGPHGADHAVSYDVIRTGCPHVACRAAFNVRHAFRSRAPPSIQSL